MAEHSKKAGSSADRKLIIILIVIIAILLAAGIIVAVYFLTRDKDEDEPAPGTNSAGQIGYDEGAVAFNEDDIREMYDQVAESQIAMKYSRQAVSTDGVHFTCDIENSPKNDKDLYFNIYLDEALTEQVLLTGLVPPGSGIAEFDSEIPLDPGTYSAVLVFTKVDDDHSTIKGQISVAYDLIVQEQ